MINITNLLVTVTVTVGVHAISKTKRVYLILSVISQAYDETSPFIPLSFKSTTVICSVFLYICLEDVIDSKVDSELVNRCTLTHHKEEVLVD